MQGLLLTELGLYDDTVERLSEFLESLPRSRAEAGRGGEPEEENGQSREKQETPMEKLKRMRMLGEEDLTARFTVKQEVKKELELYDKLKEPPKKAPILKFWKENEATLPLLSKAARVTLGVPVAQASVERTFKTAVLTVTKQRASLNSSLVETMVIMKSNNGRVDFTGIEEEPAEYDSSDYTDSEEEEEEDVIENNNDDQNTEVKSMETEIGVEEDMDEEPSTSSFSLSEALHQPQGCQEKEEAGVGEVAEVCKAARVTVAAEVAGAAGELWKAGMGVARPLELARVRALLSGGVKVLQ